MSKYFTSFLLFSSILVFSQEIKTDNESIKKEAIQIIEKVKTKPSLRMGFDLLKTTLSYFDSTIKGYEIVADYKISKKRYITAEFGYDYKEESEDYFNYKSEGNFFRVGINTNNFKNQFYMKNEIGIGVKYGYSKFDKTLIDYTVRDNIYGDKTVNSNTKYSNLNAHWLEVVMTIKVELFKNLYFSPNISIKKLISSKEPDNFSNLYIPGFGKVSLNKAGFSFGYTISYTLF
ncbi:MAG: hypothetical protein HRT66_03440 [Flavobacteriaceae bacterium]|nr:hypothetical protein [Flavobacteriaceae bacterium]